MSEAPDVKAEYQSALAEAFDAVRSVLGPEGDLQIIKHVAATGYTTARTLTAGWKAERMSGRSAGPEVFVVNIADTDPTLTTLFRDKPSQVLVADLYYKVQDVDKPIRSDETWVISCRSTGERKPT